MTAWTNYVKQYAKDKGITYKNALKDPACASSYKSGKDKPAEPAKEDNIQMKIEEKPKKRGRPKKYATPEEAKKAKSLHNSANSPLNSVPLSLIITEGIIPAL